MGMKDWKLWLDADPIELPLVGTMPRAEFEAVIEKSFEAADDALRATLRDWAADADHVAFGTWRASCGQLTCDCPVGSVSDFLAPWDEAGNAVTKDQRDADKAAHLGYTAFDDEMRQYFANVRDEDDLGVDQGVFTVVD